MLIDKQLQLSDAQAFSATGDGTNVIDASVARNLGDGQRMSLFIQVGVAADATTGDETYQFSLTTDDNASLSSDTTVETRTIARTALTAGSIHEIPIRQDAVFERYLGLVATLGGTTPSITISAWLGKSGSLPNVKTYPNGYDTV